MMFPYSAWASVYEISIAVVTTTTLLLKWYAQVHNYHDLANQLSHYFFSFSFSFLLF